MSRPAFFPPGAEIGLESLNARPTESLLTTPEAARFLRVSKSYLDKLRVYGGGPEYLRLGKRKILYRKVDLENWAEQHRFASTSQYRS